VKRISELNYVEKAMLRLEDEGIMHYRGRIIGMIFIDMNKKGYLPLPHIHVVEKMAREIYVKDGYKKAVLASGLKSFLKPNYISKNGHLRNIQNYLYQERKLAFGYCTIKGTIKGFWQFLNKEQCKEIEALNIAYLTTRKDSINHELENMIDAGFLDRRSHPILGDFTYMMLPYKIEKK
jgi:hypothetical protein